MAKAVTTIESERVKLAVASLAGAASNHSELIAKHARGFFDRALRSGLNLEEALGSVWTQGAIDSEAAVPPRKKRVKKAQVSNGVQGVVSAQMGSRD